MVGGRLGTVIKSAFAVGLFAIGSIASADSDVVQNHWADVEMKIESSVKPGVIHSGLVAFVNNLPKGEIKNDTNITDSFRTLFVEFAKRDERFQRMGYCDECVESYVMPRITAFDVTKSSKGLGVKNAAGIYDYKSGRLGVHVPNKRSRVPGNRTADEIVHTILHEVAHVFNYCEDVAELFALGLMGQDGEDKFPRWYWQYNSSQVMGLLQQMSNQGQQSRFWESVGSFEDYYNIWDEFSPRYKSQSPESNQEYQVLGFYEFQTLRALSKSMYEDRNFGKKMGRKSCPEDALERISIGLEASYRSDDNFKIKLRAEIEEMVEFAFMCGIEPSLPSGKPHFDAFGRELSNKFYKNSAVHDALSSLKNIGMCNMEILKEVGEGVIRLADGLEAEQQFMLFKNITEQKNADLIIE